MKCPICSKNTKFFASCDFHHNHIERLGTSGIDIEYNICTNCNFIFSPTIYSWSTKVFSELIYNDRYIDIDPDFLIRRPNMWKEFLVKGFNSSSIRHLDYGGGNGVLSSSLKDNGWDSHSYDPYYMEQYYKPLKNDKFNLITSFEVFEHSNNPLFLLEDISSMHSNNGIVLFSTQLTEGNLNNSLSWWYVTPRGGHISFYSRRTIEVLAKKFNYKCHFFSEGTHVLWKKVPKWAAHLNIE